MYRPFDLTGKVALVTGGNGGIGLGMAEALAQAGADLVIWGTRQDKNNEAGKTLARYGKRVASRQVDVTSEEEVAEGMESAISVMGRVDCVIANAAIANIETGGDAPSFGEITLETWRRVQAVNLDGVFFTLRAAARHMVERAKSGDPGGSLVGLGSLAAIEGAARNEAYSAAKGAVLALMRSLAVEHARFGIRANAVVPGWIETDMVRGTLNNPNFSDKVLPRVPMRRWGKPADLGGLAVYLASDASAYHTGDMFTIDGGYKIF